MKKLISFARAVRWSLILFGLLILFHLAIIIGIAFFDYAPLDFLWGGRMTTAAQLLQFEFISLLVAVACFFLVLVKAKRVHLPRLMGIASVGMWLLFGLFLLNTVGNKVAKTTFEQYFAVVTLLLAFLCLRLALEQN